MPHYNLPHNHGQNIEKVLDKIQNAVQKIDGVTSVSVNFLGQKMVLEAPDDRFDTILNEAKALIKKIEPDVTVKA